jgi:hypothetical protein
VKESNADKFIRTKVSLDKINPTPKVKNITSKTFSASKSNDRAILQTVNDPKKIPSARNKPKEETGKFPIVKRIGNIFELYMFNKPINKYTNKRSFDFVLNQFPIKRHWAFVYWVTALAGTCSFVYWFIKLT